MKHTKRTMSCLALSAVLVFTGVAASLSGNVTDTSQSSQQVYKEVIILADGQDEVTKEISKVRKTIETTTLAVATDVVTAVTGEAADPEWAGKLMADIEEYLNVREEASDDAKVVGKLYKGSIADVVEVGDEWIKIKSGNVEGYVRSEYCVIGNAVEELAEKVCDEIVVSKINGLVVCREVKESEEMELLHVMEEGETLLVNPMIDAPAGWVAVVYEGTTGYVDANGVMVTYDYSVALTPEEEVAAKEAEEYARFEAIAAAAQTSATVTADDVKLLAALIFCEAGGERYEGQIAVGAVVMNRIESSKYPNTIEDVIYQKGQFTPAGNGKVQRTMDNGKYKHCIDAAEEALMGADNTGGALHFNSGRGKGLQIGNQHFW